MEGVGRRRAGARVTREARGRRARPTRDDLSRPAQAGEEQERGSEGAVALTAALTAGSVLATTFLAAAATGAGFSSSDDSSSDDDSSDDDSDDDDGGGGGVGSFLDFCEGERGNTWSARCEARVGQSRAAGRRTAGSAPWTSSPSSRRRGRRPRRPSWTPSWRTCQTFPLRRTGEGEGGGGGGRGGWVLVGAGRAETSGLSVQNLACARKSAGGCSARLGRPRLALHAIERAFQRGPAPRPTPLSQSALVSPSLPLPHPVSPLDLSSRHDPRPSREPSPRSPASVPHVPPKASQPPAHHPPSPPPLAPSLPPTSAHLSTHHNTLRWPRQPRPRRARCSSSPRPGSALFRAVMSTISCPSRSVFFPARSWRAATASSLG